MTSVLVDAVMLSSPASVRGLGTYIRALVPCLAEQPGFKVEALVTQGTPAPDGAVPVLVHRSLPKIVNFYEQSLRLPRDILKSDADVFHSPALDPPRECARPWVQTLHDVIPMSFSHREFLVRRHMWRARGRRMREAAAVVAVSGHTANDGIRHLGLDSSRVHVVHQGVDPRFHPPAERNELVPPYVLYVGGYGPHKGLAEAFQMIGTLAGAGFPHHLKVVGRLGRRALEVVTRTLAKSGQTDRVDLLGYVATDELVRLYQQASFFAITSRYEGFCLPAVEAMASGTPVVAFANSALPEVLGEAGALVADGDVGAFADAARQVLTNPARWNELSEAGIARAVQFSWHRSAQRYAEIFRAVAVG